MYRDIPPAITVPTELCDHDAAQLLEFVQQLASIIESYYADELYRFHHRGDERQHELWPECDPPF